MPEILGDSPLGAEVRNYVTKVQVELIHKEPRPKYLDSDYVFELLGIIRSVDNFGQRVYYVSEELLVKMSLGFGYDPNGNNFSV